MFACSRTTQKVQCSQTSMLLAPKKGGVQSSLARGALAPQKKRFSGHDHRGKTKTTTAQKKTASGLEAITSAGTLS